MVSWRNKLETGAIGKKQNESKKIEGNRESECRRGERAKLE